MDAQIVNLEQWKKSHPPVIVCLNAALALGFGLNVRISKVIPRSLLLPLALAYAIHGRKLS